MRNHLIVHTIGTQDFSQQVTWPSVFNKTSNSFSSGWSQHLKINFLLPPNSAETRCSGHFLPKATPEGHQAKGFPITCEGWHPCRQRIISHQVSPRPTTAQLVGSQIHTLIRLWE